VHDLSARIDPNEFEVSLNKTGGHMKVQDVMTQEVKFCGPDTNLAAATEILWQNN
jgi:CBS domain-containing protein